MDDDQARRSKKWTPEEVERVSGVPGEQLKPRRPRSSPRRPSRALVIWCMGGTQHTIGNNNTRALLSYCSWRTGNIGQERAGGANIFRGHDNVQGATDLGVLCHFAAAAITA